MNYLEAKAEADRLDAAARDASQALEVFPRNSWGLVPDDVRASPEYVAAKRAFSIAFEASRKFNSFYVKAFKNERAADRAKRFA